MNLLVRRRFFEAHRVVVVWQFRKRNATLAQITFSPRKLVDLCGWGSAETQVDGLGARIGQGGAWARGSLLKRNDFIVAIVCTVGGEDGCGWDHTMVGWERTAR
jgi:hypothetical protein